MTLGNIFGNESNVPVHEVKVKILDTELVESVLNGLADVVVVELEEFRSDPDFLARNTGELDALSDFVFVLVTPGTVDVTVTGFEGVADGIANLTLGRLPGTETDRRDGGARVELKVRGNPVSQQRGGGERSKQ